ncbi:MAG: hypothetical protein H0X52_10275 [Gemmatimonadetes bacterium]|nr:hypothetical protein [Gemmatimonadota bacterium]
MNILPGEAVRATSHWAHPPSLTLLMHTPMERISTPLFLALLLLLAACTGRQPGKAGVAGVRPSLPATTLPPDANTCAEAPLLGDSTLAIRTGRCRYEAREDRITVSATFINRTADTVYIAQAENARWALDRWAGGEWREAFATVPTLDFAMPTVLPSGATYTGAPVLNLGAIAFFLRLPRGAEVGGTYRLRYRVYRGLWIGPAPHPNTIGEVVKGPLLPEEQRVSNPFQILDSRAAAQR